MPRHRADPCAHQSLPPSLSHPDPGVPAERSSVGNGSHSLRKVFGCPAITLARPFRPTTCEARCREVITASDTLKADRAIALHSLHWREPALGLRTIDVHF